MTTILLIIWQTLQNILFYSADVRTITFKKIYKYSIILLTLNILGDKIKS